MLMMPPNLYKKSMPNNIGLESPSIMWKLKSHPTNVVLFEVDLMMSNLMSECPSERFVLEWQSVIYTADGKTLVFLNC